MSEKPVILRGMTWAHTRGFGPLVETARQFNETDPGVTIVWDRRSLAAFEEFPVGKLAESYDLIVFDHPFVGEAAQNAPLLPLDEHLPEEFLDDQARNSVGASHASYRFGGHQWALAIDAAAPVAFWREDLLAEIGAKPPATWDDLLDLARRGHVEIPAAPINCLMNFYSLCDALGETPFLTAESVVSADIGCSALAILRELIGACDAGCLARNPIASHELVSGKANRMIAYCPFAYGYSNYARDGFAAHRLTFGEPPLYTGVPLKTTLGGTGLGVSALRPNRESALAYAAYVATGEVQRTLYTAGGGQPGHRSAWLDADNNRMTHQYFAHTLPVLDRAFLRPRYRGHIEFQHEAGHAIHSAIRAKLKDREAIARIDEVYLETLQHASVLA